MLHYQTVFHHGPQQIFVFDEIGKMELLSRDFISRVQLLLESKNPKLHVLGNSGRESAHGRHGPSYTSYRY